ncbi:MAG: C40 family peptidase [Flavipsychrobacter sp.]|nr:C40 family peptidase [Flavipsychrobacter sp.]
MVRQTGKYVVGVILMVLLSADARAQRSARSGRGARSPRFIKGLYLNAHTRSGYTANAIEPGKYPAYTPRPVVVEEIEERPVSPDQPTNKKFVHLYRPGIFRFVPTQYEVVVAAKKEPVTPDKSFDLTSDKLVGAKYADMIGLEKKDIQSPDLYRFIDKWYGTNYRLGGETEEGIDCSGFARKLYSDVYGIDLTRTAQEQYKNSSRQKKRDNAEEGDLVFFKQRGKRITHVGVYLGNDYFVHSSTSQGVVISSLKEDYWRAHYVGMGKVSKDDQMSDSSGE